MGWGKLYRFLGGMGLNKELVKQLYCNGLNAREIAEQLNDITRKIDDLISIKREKIDKLERYKQSLIYEYVTGKREVM